MGIPLHTRRDVPVVVVYPKNTLERAIRLLKHRLNCSQIHTMRKDRAANPSKAMRQKSKQRRAIMRRKRKAAAKRS